MAAQDGDSTKKRLTKKSLLVQYRKKCAKCKTGLEKELVARMYGVSVPTRPKEGWEAGTNYRCPAVRKGAQGPDYVAYVFVFLGSIIICLLCKLTLSDQYQVTVEVTISLSNLI
jgi:hypothetical protein